MSANPAFRSYTTSAAFRLSVSHQMIDMLLCIHAGREPIRNSAVANGLAHRGLINWRLEREARNPLGAIHTYEITDAGRALVPLLEMAGFEAQAPQLHVRVVK